MLLCGLAMQVKPTALLPGGFLGMTLLWCAWRAGLRWRQVTGLAISWMLLALLPLALAALYYWGRGLFEDWLFANILSIFEKAPRSEEHTSELQSLMRISYAVFCLKKKKDTYTKHQSPTTH